MTAEVVRLLDRRRPQPAEFVCEICGGEFVSSARLDHFPSCLTCRWFCRHDDRRRQALELLGLELLAEVRL